MIDWTTLLIQAIGLLAAGGIGSLVSKSGRKKAASEADIAATQARQEEFHLLKEQIELNQQQNLDLIRLISEKESRFADQTDRLREVQRELIAANDRELALTKQLAETTAQRDYWKMWHCRRPVCSDGRIPPNDLLKALRFDARAAGED